MDLSVIVPCHNLEGYIEKLLESIEVQVVMGYQVEVIFVLDSCSDKTGEILFRWAREHQEWNPLIVETDVKSCGLARNKGVEYARGKYVWFVDGDDWLLVENAMLEAIEFIELADSPYVQFDYDHSKTFMAYRYYSMVWQYIFSRESLLKFPFSSIQPHEDREFMNEYMKEYGFAPYMNKKLYYYNFGREGSNMQQFIAKGKIEL